jgi:uncharacterized membrane protein YsdA (DUF1294 family)
MAASRQGNPFWTFAAVALAVVTATTYAAVSSTLPPWSGALAGVNLATVLLYGYDKAVSGGTKRRVPENLLHLLAFLGGSPAALLSQAMFRHKTVKPSFRRTFWLIVTLQLTVAGALGWWVFRHR